MRDEKYLRASPRGACRNNQSTSGDKAGRCSEFKVRTSKGRGQFYLFKTN